MHKSAFALFILAILTLPACARLRQGRQSRLISNRIERSDVFNSGFTGFYLADAETGRTLVDVNADKLFTPASNVKILTLAVCLEVLRDSLPRFRYEYGEPDSAEPFGVCYTTGTGDPTTLHPDFAEWQQKPAFMEGQGGMPVWVLSLPGSNQLPPYPSGWMWDDFPFEYSAEITDLPLFGNCIRVKWTGAAWQTQPVFFQSMIRQISNTDQPVARTALGGEILVYEKASIQTGYYIMTPMFQARQHVPELMADTLLRRDWDQVFEPDEYYSATPKNRWYACPSDTAYRRMMHQSDNFFAEQLLILSAGEKFDTLNPKLIQRWALDSLWKASSTPLRWTDGSGLSRYNLLSPRFLSTVLQQMWRQHPRERLFDLFPAGGEEGTLNGWFKSPEGQTPYLYAKSGSMSGVYCLSGYLVAKSGRVLAFSCMNNNFTGSNKPWKEDLNALLLRIRDRF